MTTKIAKHTPGPWEVTNRMPAFECVAIVECSPDHALTIDAVGSRRPTQYEWEANARLIATAPALLEALEACLPFVAGHVAMTCQDDWAPIADRLAYDKAEAAIRAAVGAQEENTQ